MSRDNVGKIEVPLRSSIVRKIAKILIRMIWLAMCLIALVYAYKGYQGSSDWKLEEGLAFEMMATWFLFVVAGYVQWFVVVPRLLRRWQGKNKKEKS